MDKNISLKIELNVWYEEKSGIIKLAGGEPDNGLRSTVSNNQSTNGITRICIGNSQESCAMLGSRPPTLERPL